MGSKVSQVKISNLVYKINNKVYNDLGPEVISKDEAAKDLEHHLKKVDEILDQMKKKQGKKFNFIENTLGKHGGEV